jgi:hypothetical protein
VREKGNYIKKRRAFSWLEIEQKTRAKQAGENQYQEPDK